jgi:proteic killer suppression protein
MIRSFRDKRTAAVFEGRLRKGLAAELAAKARRGLERIDAAEKVEDLRLPPGNRLEKLAGDRAGQWSIRVNDQWRICFVWRNDGPHEVELVDYH